MSLDELIDALDAAGVDVDITETSDQLRIDAPRGVLTPALRQAIMEHKPTLIAALTGFHPLDPAIVTSEARRRSLEEIEARLARQTEAAARPTATALDRHLARDWTMIRAVKLAATGATPPAA